MNRSSSLRSASVRSSRTARQALPRPVPRSPSPPPPRRRQSARGLFFILGLSTVLGLGFLSSHMNLSILEASRMLAERRRAAGTVEREVDAMRVVVGRLGAIDRIEPEGRRFGLERPEAQSVMLVAAGSFEDMNDSRPLGARNPLGRWFARAARAARVPSAVASPAEDGTAAATGTASATITAAATGKPRRAASPVAGEHGARGSRCEVCRALAAGQTVHH